MLSWEVRKDAAGVEERLGYLPTDRGELYTYMARPPSARSCVVICSSVFGDFTSNYHRERLLAKALISHGFGVLRFHYFGEGNSEGQRSEMTFSGLCRDADAVIAQAVLPGFSDFAVMGTRMGALVAAESVRSHQGVPLILWEPVSNATRFIDDALRAKKMSRMTQKGGAAVDREAQLLEVGVIDLLGYDLHPGLVQSFAGIDLLAALGHERRQILIARFRSVAGQKDELAHALIQRGFSVTSDSFGLTESWWFHSERLPESGDLIASTTRWLSGLLGPAK